VNFTYSVIKHSIIVVQKKIYTYTGTRLWLLATLYNLFVQKNECEKKILFSCYTIYTKLI